MRSAIAGAVLWSWALACMAGDSFANTTPGDHIYERSTGKTVAEAVEDVEFAITERNYRVTSRLHVGKGIRERDHIAFPDYEVILFCNLGLARRMLEHDPAFINFCPGRVTVRGAGNQTRISAPLLPEGAGLPPALAELTRRVNAHLREIVDYGIEDWDLEVP